jgi:pilus assembly protein CpaF
MSLLRQMQKGNKDDRNKGGSSGGGDEQKRRPKRRRRSMGDKKSGDNYSDIKQRIQNRLLSELDPSMDISRKDEVRRQIQELFSAILQEEGMVLSKTERERLFESIVADILGLGPLEPLLDDEDVTEIMVNGPKNVFVERAGKVSLSGVTFESEEHVLRVIDRIVAPLGRRVDESSPLVDARLQDGSRVNVVIRPIALCGPTITIRKFSKDPFGVQDLIRFGTMTREMAKFLRACVVAALNMIISGGTGSGKTTTLNVMSSFIPNDERIITVENAAELQLQQEHVVPLESRPPNIEGKGEITIRDLVINCLRMRPERIVVGECRGAEALDMLQAMNTGHDGSLTTLHANTPRDALARLEVMSMMAGMELPTRAIREQVSSAVDVIVQQTRMRDGSRRITHVTEVQGMEGEMVTLTDIFEFEQTGFENNKIVGRLRATGIRPKFYDRIEDAGINLPPSIFGIGGRR